MNLHRELHKGFFSMFSNFTRSHLIGIRSGFLLCSTCHLLYICSTQCIFLWVSWAKDFWDNSFIFSSDLGSLYTHHDFGGFSQFPEWDFINKSTETLSLSSPNPRSNDGFSAGTAFNWKDLGKITSVFGNVGNGIAGDWYLLRFWGADCGMLPSKMLFKLLSINWTSWSNCEEDTSLNCIWTSASSTCLHSCKLAIPSSNNTSVSTQSSSAAHSESVTESDHKALVSTSSAAQTHWLSVISQSSYNNWRKDIFLQFIVLYSMNCSTSVHAQQSKSDNSLCAVKVQSENLLPSGTNYLPVPHSTSWIIHDIKRSSMIFLAVICTRAEGDWDWHQLIDEDTSVEFIEREMYRILSNFTREWRTKAAPCYNRGRWSD